MGGRVPSAPMATEEQTSLDRATILVVDDDGDIRMALEMLLSYEGYEVWTAKDGREAVARLDAEEAKEFQLVDSTKAQQGYGHGG